MPRPSTGVLAVTVWEPIGVVGAITPFNAPFNLVTHKVAPAFAAGNAIVVKPASQAPLSALDVARVMEEAGAPAGAINVVPGNRQTVAALLDDARVGMYTLTGSRDAGEAVVRGAGLRRVTLELGGNSPNIVHRDASLEMAVAACVRGGFANTGQSCNSVQRVIVHREIVDAFTARVVEMTRDLVVGDPMDPTTDVGTLVDEAAAARIEVWLAEAGQAGARVLVGGERQGAQLRPSVVADAPLDARLVCEEVSGPVLVVLLRRPRRGDPAGKRDAVWSPGGDLHRLAGRRAPSCARPAGRWGAGESVNKLPPRSPAIRRREGERHRQGGAATCHRQNSNERGTK